MPNRVPTSKSSVVPLEIYLEDTICPHNFIGMTADGYKYCQSCMKIFNWKGDVIDDQ